MEDLEGERGSGGGASMPSSGTVASSVSPGVGVIQSGVVGHKGGAK